MNNEEDHIDELLQSTELAQTPNIVQELFHRMNNKIESLSNKLNLLERKNEDIVTKDYLNTVCAAKVDINDFLNTVNNIDQHIKQKPSFDEIKYLSEEKISRTDLNEVLQNYINKKNFDDFVDTLPKSFDIKDLNLNTNNKIDSLIIDMNKKFNTLPTFKDIDKLNNLLTTKANLSEVQNILSSKVDKNDFVNILNTKPDYNYIDEQLKKKLDIFVWDKIQNDISNKVNIEDWDKMQEDLEKKIDIEAINNIMKLINNKIDKNYLDEYMNDILLKEHDINDTKFKALDIDFDRFIESVKNQFNNINQVVNKLSKDKVDKTFFEERLNIKLDTRKFISDLDKFNQENKLKLNETFLKNKENLENFNLKINEFKLSINNQIDGFKDDMRNVIKELNTLTNNVQYNFDMLIKEKNNNEFYKNETSDKLQNLFEKIESKVATNIFNKNIIKVQDDLKKYIMNITQEKITYNEVEKLIKNIDNKNGDNLSKYKNGFDMIIKDINTQILSLNKDRITLDQLNDILNNKINEVNDEMNKKASINDLINLSNKIKQLSNNLIHKLDIKIFEENKNTTNNLIEKINTDLSNKYNKNEEDNLLKEKCNLDTFNSVIRELNNLIDAKLDLIEYQKFTDIQEVINNIYLTENSTGIWKWVSTKLNNGYIPLEIEYYNTMRDNYLWEEDRTSLMIINKGVYNIKVVIFTNEPDVKVTLVVNGENLVSKVAEKPRSSQDQDVPKNNKYTLQSVKIDEFLSINDKVRISVLFDGKSSNSKGYLKISSVHFEQDKDFDIKNTKFVEEQINENQKNILPLLQEIDSSQRSKV
jgi:hypothetical protein